LSIRIKRAGFSDQAWREAEFQAEVLSMRRGDLMKPDLLSEIVLLGSGAVIFVAWLFIMMAALTGQIH
jgi:hypothetical protein